MGWLRRLLFRNHLESQLDRELRDHFDRLVAEYRRTGLPESDARRRARLAFGGVEQIKEDCRDVRGTRAVEAILLDARYAVRTLSKSPGFTLVAILCLALGIGASAAVFSVFNAVLLRPLPYSNPDELAVVFKANPKRGALTIIGLTEFLRWREQARAFSGLVAAQGWTPALTGVEQAERLSGLKVSGGLFQMLGVPAAVGRAFDMDDDPSQGRVVVLSQSLWDRVFRRDQGLVGRSIRLDGESYTVMGVMPAGFQFPLPDAEFWVPLPIDRGRLDPGDSSVFVVGRVRPGLWGQAGAELETALRQLDQQFPNAYAGWEADLLPLRDWYVSAGNRRVLWLLIGAVGVVLLTACANIANLLLARGSAREQELIVRLALGAGRTRIISQLLTESAVLGLAGGGLGLLLSIWGRDVLLGLLPAGTAYRLMPPVVDWRVLLFSLGVSCICAVLFGLLPAHRASRAHIAPGPPTMRVAPLKLRSILLIVQTATAVILLAGATVLGRSLANVWRIDPGFAWDNVVAARISLPARQPETRQVAFYGQAVERLEHLPGIVDAGAISNLPLGGANNASYISIEGHPEFHADPSNRPGADRLSVTPGLFRTLRIAVREGREFTAEDTADSLPVAIVNRALAERYYPGTPAIGKRIKRGTPQAPFTWRTIVGVVGDVKLGGLMAAPGPTLYLPHAQSPAAGMALVVRTNQTLGAASADIRSVVRSIDPEQPVPSIRRFDDIVMDSLASRRFPTLWMAIFAVLALVLSALGLYGVVNYSVARRRSEFGIRVALGAQPRDLVRLAVAHGLWPTMAGVSIGLVVAAVSSRALSSLVVGVTPRDGLSFATAAAVQVAVAFVASYAPARRASRQSPTMSLRHE